MMFDGADQAVLIFYLRTARNKARAVAEVEAASLLRDLQATVLPGGPLSEQGGLFWIGVPADNLSNAQSRLPRLGYTSAVDLVQPIPQNSSEPIADPEPGERRVRWKRQQYRLVQLYEEDPEALRELAPDRRTFLLETSDGEIRQVKGYRGDGQALSRRGLPVYDARLLVNLAGIPDDGVLLDPFAGIGGILIEARASGWSVVSCDIDPELRHGLAALGDTHYVADACEVPLDPASVDAIATEPPYDATTAGVLKPALSELHRVLKSGGHLAMLCAAWQAEPLREYAAVLGLHPFLDAPINRKGTDVVVLAWLKE
jgi:SAM-dependent methyltransferase